VPTSAHYQVGLANAHHKLGEVAPRLGRGADAEAAYCQNLRLREPLATGADPPVRYPRALAHDGRAATLVTG
jgi:hypothetical protein